MMRSRRANGLVTIAALVALAAVGGNAARGSDDVPPTATATAPVVTISRTPAPTTSAARAAPTPTPTPVATPTAAARTASPAVAAQTKATTTAAASTWAVTKVVDGDTLWASRNGVTRKIRFIGIDTPETGQCGFSEARNALRGIIGGQRVTLTPGARDDADRYGRLLRYVDVNGVDAGLRLVKQGYAVARYDSRDGYGSHHRESAYVRADAASPKAACADPNGATSGGTSGTGGAGGTDVSGSWPQAGDQYPCPRSRPVKGNEGSMIAHEPTDRYYNITKPEQCFATMSDAEAAGFRPAKV